ncbi:MAG: PQQ-binding-like beta-propeller repeat protein [Planctomycetota bacterium]|nr:PQQ-binding-like beta-propeller repeat protein [Planctomycetota bacterium]MDA0919972.1 PQQ-binding-like beta-propeller repeat protein [Planctomycetota bacterium]MDA1159035.1 PQQ-binding-like beta-propeller repeat protein [Planctomycetota bacterium]
MRLQQRDTMSEPDRLGRREFVALTAGLAAAGLVNATGTGAEVAQNETGETAWASFRNGNQLRGIATSPLPEKLELLWKVPVDDGVTATAAIVGDHVFAATYGGELICLERKTGKRVWTYFSEEKKKPTSFIPGFQASPTVTSELVLIGDEYGVFHAVERASGKLRWKYETQAEIICSAAIVKDRIIFGSYDSTLYCLGFDGKELWKRETGDRINGSPAIAGNITFVTGCDQHLRAINIDSGEEEFDLELGHFMIASPAVDKYMLYVGTHESDFLALNLETQEVVWRFKDEAREFPIHSSAALTDDRIIFGGQDKQIHCLERKTGKELWNFATRGQVNSSPVIVGRNRIFVGSNDGYVYEIGLNDGKQRWKEKLGRSVTASPAVGEGCLVIGAEGSEGQIHCFGQKV